MSFGPELVRAVSMSLNREVLPTRIIKIETGSSWAAFRLSGSGGKWLLFSWHPISYGCGIVDEKNIKTLKKTVPGRSSFGEALKRNLQKAALISARQMNQDRLLSIEAERLVGAGFSVQMRIVFEGTERNSNFMMLDDKGIIHEPAKHIHGDVNRYRMIIPGISYTPPPPLRGKTLEETGEINEAGDIRNLIGIGRGLSRLIEEHWGLYGPKKWEEMVRAVLASEEAPLQLQRHGNLLTVFPVLLPGGEALAGDLLANCGEDILSSWFAEQRRIILARARRALEREIKSRIRRKEGLENQNRLFERGPEFLKMGNLLVSAGHYAPRNISEISLTDWETGEPVKIPLDPSLSVFANADRYFKKYKKGKVDKDALEKRMKSVDEGIAELREQLENLEFIDDPEFLSASVQDVLEWVGAGKRKAKSKKKVLPPHIRLENGGDLIYVGLNARGNRHVTFRVAGPSDIWFHVHESPGAHVILKAANDSEGPAPASIEIAASLAAWFSRARNSGKVQVDYTDRKYVRSIPGSALAHVTYTNPRTVLVNPGLWKEFSEVARSVQLEERT